VFQKIGPVYGLKPHAGAYVKSNERRLAMRKIVLIILLIVCLTIFTGCIGVKGSGEGHSGSPTLGQELIDLQKARNDGAISQDEYVELKEKLKQMYD
jgi:hypothetical protein